MNKLKRLEQDRLNVDEQLRQDEPIIGRDEGGYYTDSGYITTRLFVITYEHLDGGVLNIFTVGVDMDDATAEMLVVKDLAKTLEPEFRKDATIENFDVCNIQWEAVPNEVDGWQVVLNKEL